MDMTSPTNSPPPKVLDIYIMVTEITPHSVGDDGRNVSLRPFYNHEYIRDEVWARMKQLRDTAHPLRDIHVDYIDELTVSMKRAC